MRTFNICLSLPVWLRGLVLAALLAGVVLPTHAPSLANSTSSSIYFDASNPDLLKLGNTYYELGLNKSNGGIAYILDKTSGGQTTLGSHNGCLWGAVDSKEEFWIGGCSYYKDNPGRHFSYAWSAINQTLTYTMDASYAQRMNAEMFAVLAGLARAASRVRRAQPRGPGGAQRPAPWGAGSDCKRGRVDV